MPRGRRVGHRAAHVNHHRPVVVNRGPVVVRRPPPVGAAMMTGMMMGATTGLMIGAMSRRRNQTKVKDNKIIVIQPFPGTLVAKVEHGNAEFFTVPFSQPIPDGTTVVLRPGEKGVAVQISDGHHLHFSVIPPGKSVPHGNNVKIIETKLAPGTLVEVEENGTKVQTVIPPGQQIPPGSIVLQRPDGKPPAGTLVVIQQPDGRSIQQVIPDGQPIPAGAQVIPTQHSHPKHSHDDKAKKQNDYPAPPTNVTVDKDTSRSGDHEHDHDHDHDKDKKKETSEVPAYAQFPKEASANAGDANVPAYMSNLSKDPPAQPAIQPSVYQPYAAPPTNTAAYQPQQPYQAQQTQQTQAQPAPYAQQPQKQQNRPQSGKSKPPVWDLDTSTDHCTKCKRPFNVTHRRHHCRNCGKIFCAECSSNEISLPHISIYAPERVCDSCYENVTGRPAPHNNSGGCVIS